MSYILRIFIHVRSLWPYYVGIILLGFITTGLNLAGPFILKAATDTIVSAHNNPSPNVTPIIWLSILFFLSGFVATLISNWTGYLGDMMSTKLRQTLSDRYYEHLLKLPQKYFDNELTGTIINRLNRTIVQVSTFINMFSNNIFSMYLTLIVSLIILLIYSWQLALMMAILYPLFLWLTSLTSKKWQTWQKQYNLETDLASGRFAEVVTHMRVVKSFISEKTELDIFSKHNKETVAITRSQSSYWHSMDIGRRTVLNIIFALAISYVLIYTMLGRFSLGDLVLLTSILTQMMSPIFNMSFVVDNFQKAIAGSRDYFEVMTIKPAVADIAGASDIQVGGGGIEYNNVSFGYGKKSIINNVSFTVEAGEKVAFVGESGEGKTTLTNLLLRLYDVREGNITVYGQDISKTTQDSLRKNIAVVFQDPALFSGTVRDNIAYADHSISDEKIKQAAQAANAHEFIMKFDDGYNTEIGERGIKLSGGQKQRIAIARAILKDAPILVLDEATSSLDSRAEREVQAALDKLMQNRTTIIVAHRLSTIANVDKIITLKNGKIDEIGTPKELAKTDGIYGQLLHLQLGDTEKTKVQLAKFDIANN